MVDIGYYISMSGTRKLLAAIAMMILVTVSTGAGHDVSAYGSRREVVEVAA